MNTVSCTLNGVGAGHALVIGVYISGTTTPTITSSSGTPATVISNLADYQGEMDTAILANTTSGNITITATTSGYENIWITVSEYSGVANSPLDTTCTASQVGGWDATTVSTGNFNTDRRKRLAVVDVLRHPVLRPVVRRHCADRMDRGE